MLSRKESNQLTPPKGEGRTRAVMILQHAVWYLSYTRNGRAPGTLILELALMAISDQAAKWES